VRETENGLADIERVIETEGLELRLIPVPGGQEATIVTEPKKSIGSGRGTQTAKPIFRAIRTQAMFRNGVPISATINDEEVRIVDPVLLTQENMVSDAIEVRQARACQPEEQRDLMSRFLLDHLDPVTDEPVPGRLIWYSFVDRLDGKALVFHPPLPDSSREAVAVRAILYVPSELDLNRGAIRQQGHREGDLTPEDIEARLEIFRASRDS
jgi:hypothetical protein